MKNDLIEDLNRLEEMLQGEIRQSPTPLAIIGGHYALDRNLRPSVFPDGNFGIFPDYTLRLASRLVKYSQKIGNSAKIVIIVDDHSQMPDRLWYMQEQGLLRENIRRSFENYTIPDEFKEIMRENGLSESDILSSKDSLVFQESRYRELFAKKTGLVPGCAGEYRSILDEIEGRGIRKTIGLIPLICQSPTCTALDPYTKNSSSPMEILHVYLSTNDNNQTEKDLEKEMLLKLGGIPTVRKN